MSDEECLKLWENLSCGYTETQGHPVLRKEIANMINQDMSSKDCYEIESHDILVFAGGEEGIFTTLKSLLSQHDHAIIVTPCYQSVKSVTETICDVSVFDLDPSDNWTLDIAKLEAAILPSTKIIMINFPNNPTGANISNIERQAIVVLAKKYDLWIFSDEIYHGVDRSENSNISLAVMYDKAISLGGVSKSFGLAGLRIGWIYTKNEGALCRISGNKHYLSICNSAPSEILSLIALRNRHYIWNRQKEIIFNNLKALRSFLLDHSNLFRWCEPQGGCCGFVEVLNHSLDLNDVAERLAEETGLLILPGSNFPCSQHNRHRFNSFMRIGFGRVSFINSLGDLELVVEKYFK